MSIRTYLTLSYLVLILLLATSVWALADKVLSQLTIVSLSSAGKGAQRLIDANCRISQEILTTYGKSIMADKLENAAKELSFRLEKKKVLDYGQLREDQAIRKIATQEIHASEGVAGHLIMYDRNGENIFHPDKEVEGWRRDAWREQFPEMWHFMEQSFQKEKLSGYLTFFDEQDRECRRYSVSCHIPQTPFVLAAVVNLDEFYLPAQAKIKEVCQDIMTESKGSIQKSSHHLAGQVKVISFCGGLLLCLLSGLYGLLFAATISEPIVRLEKGVKEVGEGNFAVAVPETGLKEVVNLAHTFNQLGRHLVDYIEKRDFIRDTFGRYVTQEVVKKLLEDKGALELGGETREITILMSDLRGFTALIADMAPEDVITFLNRFLAKMIEILTDYQAVIDEIVGDGILAFFGAPEPREDHPARAVACALAMQGAMDEINALNEALGLPHLDMGVAVNTGTVVVGNIGSEKRAKYSVVGSHVNFTSRIESYAVGGQVLISSATYNRVQDLVEVGSVVKVEMKGIPEPVSIYEVEGIGAPYHLTLKKRGETPVALPERIPVRVSRISDKVLTGATEEAWITHLGENAAVITYRGQLVEWEDVRLCLLDENLAEMPGKIYGKVTAVSPCQDGFQATIRFTSVPQEIYRVIRRMPAAPESSAVAG